MVHEKQSLAMVIVLTAGKRSNFYAHYLPQRLQKAAIAIDHTPK